ncbi:MAG TPA: dihydrodipicolinate synthase family protein [Chloroflexota bacterium]|nr:dihydrodipicolinate synthase family protein [Chloroflexota bacterium]
MSTFDMVELQGIVPPILTPFTPDEQVDLHSLARLTRWLIHQGVHGIWACGTTGEFASLSADDREDVIGTCVENTTGRVPVVANIADCGTKLTIEHGKRALRAGADAVAATPPYYYLNSQDELLDHYRAIREAVDAPLFVYNIPSTVKTKVEVDTIVTLAAEGTVVGVKDSQGDMDFARSLVTQAKARGAALRVFLGTRSLIDAAILLRSDGCIPGLANVAPRACVDAYKAATQGDWSASADAQARAVATLALGRTIKGSVQAANLGGMKAALKAMGIIAHSRLSAPLRSPTPAEEETIAGLVPELGLLAPTGSSNGRARK